MKGKIYIREKPGTTRRGPVCPKELELLEKGKRESARFLNEFVASNFYPIVEKR